MAKFSFKLRDDDGKSVGPKVQFSGSNLEQALAKFVAKVVLGYSSVEETEEDPIFDSVFKDTLRGIRSIGSGVYVTEVDSGDGYHTHGLTITELR